MGWQSNPNRHQCFGFEQMSPMRLVVAVFVVVVVVVAVVAVVAVVVVGELNSNRRFHCSWC